MSIKKFKEFNNYKFTQDQIVDSIKNGKFLLVKNVKNLPNHSEEVPVLPLDIDEDGLITIDIDGRNYEVDLKNVIKIKDD